MQWVSFTLLLFFLQRTDSYHYEGARCKAFLIAGIPFVACCVHIVLRSSRIKNRARSGKKKLIIMFDIEGK